MSFEWAVMEIDKKSLASFFSLFSVAVVVGMALFYGLSFHPQRTGLGLSPKQMDKLQRCLEEEGAPEDQLFIESDVVCFPATNAKRDIVLLATYPVTGEYLIGALYEKASTIASFSQYPTNPTYIHAYDFQTGPWKLYCLKDPREEVKKCAFNSPPPENVPFLVQTNFPVYEKVCGHFGYPLPRHERIIHIVRNPFDNIDAWIHHDNDSRLSEMWSEKPKEEYIEKYGEWHSFWQGYHLTERTPTLWIRHEDLCICLHSGLEILLDFAEVLDHTNQEALRDIISRNPCVEDKEIGISLAK